MRPIVGVLLICGLVLSLSGMAYSAPPCDLDGDVDVDGLDLAILAAGGGETECILEDFVEYFGKVDWVVVFPDPNLEGVVRDEISKPSGDILYSDLAILTSLEAGRLSISDISGLEYCTNLTYLYLSINQISDISPLAGLVNLNSLHLYNNQISDISPLAELVSLTSLVLERNRIADISPLAGLVNLTKLNLFLNRTTDISPLSGLVSLTDLDLCYNSISDISPLTGLVSLTRLSLDHNRITDISPLVDNPGIVSGDDVDLRSNPLSAYSCTVLIPVLEARGVNVDFDEECGMASIPADCFNMGDAFTEGGTNELPIHSVCISAFEIDLYEVTNAEYAECVGDGACTLPSNLDSYTRLTYYDDPDYDYFPVIHVDWNQAMNYCTWADKRLPTEAEWELAARGGWSGRRYPWGDTISSTDANYYIPGDNDTSPAGYYPPNDYGLYDVAGNVWEWTNDWYQDDYYTVSPPNDPPGPATGTNRVLRGGSFNSSIFGMRLAFRNPRVPQNGYYNIGFRCARGEATPCADIDCGEHGECVYGTCECSDGYTGNQCETPPDPCAGVNCGEHGTCVDGSCECTDDYTGELCDIPPSPKIVFITESLHNGNLGGISGADAICQADADAAGLTGTFKAWLSDATTSPDISFTKNPLPYVLVDGSIVADDWADLTDAWIYAPIDQTAAGSTVDDGYGSMVWTNTYYNGQRYDGAVDYNCDSWTIDSQSNAGVYGQYQVMDLWSRWTYSARLACDRLFRLYCFAQ